MKAQKTQPLRCYLRAGNSQDLVIRHRLAQRTRETGQGASAVIRQALAEHLGLAERAALTHPQARELLALVGSVKELTAEVQALRSEVQALRSEVQQLTILADS